MCIDIVEIWLGIAMGKFRQILTELSGILTKLCTYTDIKEIWFGTANGQFSSIIDRVICPRQDNGGVL